MSMLRLSSLLRRLLLLCKRAMRAMIQAKAPIGKFVTTILTGVPMQIITVKRKQLFLPNAVPSRKFKVRISCRYKKIVAHQVVPSMCAAQRALL